MAKILLNTEAFEAEFFSGTLLYALGAAGIKDYRMCWNLNQYLGLCFCRKPELDIAILHKMAARAIPASLFDAYIEERNRLFYFPVFCHEISGVDAVIYLYSNRCEERVLIPELKSADFFLLIPQTAEAPEKEWLPHCETMPGISWIREIALENLRSRRNFIL